MKATGTGFLTRKDPKMAKLMFFSPYINAFWSAIVIWLSKD